MGNKQVVTTKLSDLCELIVDCPHSTPEWTDSGFIVLRNQNIRNGSLDLSSPSFTDENGYNSRIKRAVPQAGDIVLTREAPMGEVCLIPEGLQCCLGQRQVLLRPMKGMSGEYLFWALQSPFVRHQISWSEGTGTTVSNIRIPVLKAFEIPRWFENEPQIASHLSAIKNKITLNQKINQTLEQMAQALFKSWFVDFDPVVDNALDAGFFEQDLALPDELLRRAEARRAVREHGDFKPLPDATRQLFPAAFEECAEPSLGLGGWVPKGWVAATFSDLADVVMGQSPKGDAYNSNGIGTPLINGPVEFGEYHPVKSKWTTSTTKMSEKNDLIVCVRGSTTGRYVISDGEYCLGRGVCAVRGGLIQPFITYQFKSNITTLLGLATGSTFPSWSGPLLKKHIVLKPSAGPIKKFCAIAGSNLKKMGDLDVENLALSELRETLLPKLISGELSLDQIQSDLTKEGMA